MFARLMDRQTKWRDRGSSNVLTVLTSALESPDQSILSGFQRLHEITINNYRVIK